jgi:hypothetical protein
LIAQSTSGRYCVEPEDKQCIGLVRREVEVTRRGNIRGQFYVLSFVVGALYSTTEGNRLFWCNLIKKRM